MRRCCVHPGCPDPPTHGSRCARHGEDTRRPRDRRVYNSKRWKVVRRRVLFEHPLCPCGAIATDVDHLVPLPEGAPFDRANLQALCGSCHAKKTRREQLR